MDEERPHIVTSTSSMLQIIRDKHELMQHPAHHEVMQHQSSLSDDEEEEEEDEDEVEDPCSNHKCAQGSQCVARRPGEYTCKCQPGYSGRYCETAPTCTKVQTREYYQENGCKSRKPIKMARCEGGCGSSCCRARKTKRRKVRLICSNGSQYTKDIEIVRKCACTKKCY